MFLLIAFSCSNEKTSKNIQIEDQATLNPVKLELKGKEVLSPGSISIVDSTLFVIERDVASEIISSFSLQNFKLENSYGKRGRGPNEFSKIIQKPVSTSGASINSLHIFDWVNKRLKKFNSTNLRKGKTSDSVETYTLPPNLMLTQRAVFLNDTTVIAMGGIYKGLLAFANTNSDDVTYLNPYQLNSEQYSNRNLSELYRGEFAINFTNNSIALASKYIPEILITNFEGKILRKISISNYNLTKIADTPVEKRALQFQDIKVTRNYIYAVHIGENRKQLQKRLNSEKAKSQGPLSEIHIYDWDGNPIKKLILKGGYFPFIEIDKKHDRIFSINAFSPTSQILYFKSKFDLE